MLTLGYKRYNAKEMWINPIDAQNRGIKNGDMVRIYNDRGITQIPALVTERIIPGVVGLQAGAWWSP
ncbi:dimethyl sulfoxide reductase chain A precursor [Proteus mirabilis]|uniref:Dimethyl sulfoxide reductase chain A n=1 Tax=Proteus mirabilis TaxID=584 RepID=A0A379GJP4_PROMI|nr:dimethyl sulfoxide reductase chain A precursor [Proteus mirabilis]